MLTDLPDTAPTPGAMLGRISFARKVADAAEVEILELAVAWAHAHPDLDRDGNEKPWRVRRTAPVWQPGEYDASVARSDDLDVVEWCGIPGIAWDAPAAFAAATSMTTTAGKAVIRDALVLKHRLPLVWSRVLAGEVQAWRARRIAQTVLGAHADVAADLDARIAPIAGTVGPVTLSRLLDEAMLRLHAEEREIKQLEDLDARYVRLLEGSINDSGIADLIARGDWKDLHDLDQALSALAACLKEQGCEESLEVRRSMALGILADPERAHAMLTGADAPPPARKQVVVHLHLSEAALRGHEVVGRNATTGQPVLAEQVRAWCSRTDTHVVIKPVRDLNDAAGTHAEAYEIPDRLREHVTLLHPTCVFPFCTKSSAKSDLDHIVAYDDGGATAAHNLAPLCRHHHRLKTHAGWTYRPLDPDDPLTAPGTFLWTDPHGNAYLRTPTGTTVLTDDVEVPRVSEHSRGLASR
jgi:5-methylcytosine-specific restriction endonuclease McrA